MKKLILTAAAVLLTAAYSFSRPASQAPDATDNEEYDTAYIETFEDIELADSDITVKHFFLALDEFGQIDETMRMDMVDYYSAGMKKSLSTRLGGEAYIDSISDGNDYMRVVTSSVSSTEVRVYKGKGHPFYAVINHVKMPARDSRVKFITLFDDASVESIIQLPTIADYINISDKQKRDDIASMIDFPLAEITFLADGSLCFNPTLEDYLSREAAAKVLPCLKKNIIYRWDGKKFRMQK